MATAGGKRSLAKGSLHHVHDAKLLAAVVDDAVTHRFNGSVKAAARASRIPYNQLKRLRLGRVKAMREESRVRLKAFLGRAASPALQEAIVPFALESRLERFDAWADMASAVITFGLEATNTFSLKGLRAAVSFDPRDVVSRDSRRAAQMEAARRHRLARSLLDELQERFPSFWAPLERILKRGTVSPSRATLARFRVIAPLLDWQHSFGIERVKFTPRELQRLIKAGVTRECIMLRREPDVIRATVR